MKDEIQKMIDAVGALAELKVLYREELLRCGVPYGEAVKYTQTFIFATLRGGKNGQA